MTFQGVKAVKWLLFILAGFMLAVLLWAGYAYASSNKAPAKGVEEDLKLIVGDEEGNEEKALRAEILIGKSEDRALQQLSKLLKKYKGTPMEAGLYFRQAELYMRKAKSARFFEVHRDNEIVTRFMPEVVKNSSSKNWITKAIETYDMIERRFSHFRDMDMVLFNNAFARQLIGQDALAIKLYNRVIENHPESALVPDCFVAIGEYYFQNQKYQQAFEEFKKIRNYPDARVYPFGIYKEAWALYNLKEGARALKDLEEVVSYSKDSSPMEESNKLDLSREATQDMVLFFEDVKDADVAVSYFRRQVQGDQQVGSLIVKLGRLYQRHGKWQQLEVVFNDLISALPQVPERPEIHRDLMDVFVARKRPDLTLQEIKTLAEICVDGSKWSGSQSPETRKECWTQLSGSSRHFAARWHKEFKKEPASNRESGKLALDAYETWLQFNKSGLEEEKFHFSFAELLFQMAEFRKASAQYSLVGSLTKDSKMKHDASYGSIVALEKATGDKWNDDDEKLFQKLASSYITFNPKGEFVTDVRFKKAFIAYEKGRYQEAGPQLRALALELSDKERSQKAAHLYLDIWNIQKDFEKLKEESRFFVKNLKELDEKTRVEFNTIYEESSFSLVQQHESNGKAKEAADEYLAFASEHTRSKLADKALLNGAHLYQVLGDYQAAAKALEAFVTRYPDSLEYKNSLKTLVHIYESQVKLELAARTLLKLAPFEKDKVKLWLAAADYFALDGQWSEAESWYSKLSAMSQEIEAVLATERLAELHEHQGHSAQSERFLRQIAQSRVQPQASLASLRLAQIEEGGGDEKAAFEAARKTVSQRKERGFNKWAVAQARLIQAKILQKEFERASLKVSQPERLSMVISIKAEKLAKTQEAFQDAIKMGDPATAVEALVLLGAVYEEFADSINAIKLPESWSPEEKKKLAEEMENIATPIEEKNADSLQAALKLSKDTGLHDGSVPLIQEKLDHLTRKPAREKWVTELGAPESAVPLKPESVGKQLSVNAPAEPWGPFFLGQAAFHRGEMARARWLADLSLQRSPLEGTLHYFKGRLLWADKLFPQAIEEMERAATLQPSLAPAQNFLGRVYLRDQDYGKAQEHFTTLLKYKPNDPVALKGLVEVRHLASGGGGGNEQSREMAGKSSKKGAK